MTSYFNTSKVLFCFLLSLLWIGAKAQTKVDLNLIDVSVLEVIERIEAASDYRFIYNRDDVQQYEIERLSFQATKVPEILEYIETQVPLEFLVRRKSVSIRVNLDALQQDQYAANKRAAELKENQIRGVVRNSSTGESLIGAAVYFKDYPTKGTVTDLSGRFQLSIPKGSQFLIISYVGFQDQEVSIGTQTEIEVELSVAASTLDEVVVVGYTEKKVKDLTGAVGLVKLEEVKNQPINSLEQALQGRVAGTQVTSDGAPGGGVSVRIRGYGTIGDNEPLYIIDGVPTKSGLNQFNVNDIASMQILKDAAATAIYGARAANGVVIITTKKGKYEGEQKILFDHYIGVQEASNLPAMLNTQEYADLFWQAQKNAGLIPSNDVFGSNAEAPIVPEFLDAEQTIRSNQAGTDWFGELFAPALIQSYNLGYVSGTERGRMAFSASYFNQEGIIRYTGFERYTLRSNTEFKAAKDILKIGQNISFSYSDRTAVPANAALGSRIIHAYRMNPIVPVRDINGNWASSVKGVQGAENPVALNFFDRNDQRLSSRIFGNVYAILEPIKNLKLKTNFGIDYELFNLKNYSPRFQMGDALRAVNSFEQINRNTLNWVWNNTLSYSRQFQKHKLNFLAGTEAIRFNLEEFGASRDNFFTDDLNYIYLNSGEGQQTNFGEGTRWALFSIFGRLDYSFDEKYLLGVALRRDGSSRFSSSNRYAVFPAFSVAWRLSSEPFLKANKLLDDLKLRLSWGQSGNQEIGDFASFSSFATNSNDTNYDLNGTNSSVITGFTPNRLGNPNIVWETTSQSNIGVDATMFDYHLRFSVDYFIKNTENILLQRPTLAIEGQAEPPFVNAGRMKNQGLELQIAYSGNIGQDFSFELSLNGTAVRNEVLELADDVEFIPGFVSNSSTRNLTISRTQVGLPIAQLYGHVVEGIFNSQGEVDSHAEQVGKAIGRLKFQDLNGDGLIDDKDRTVIGNPHPDYVYGMNFNARYKNFDCSIFLQGVQGVELYNFTRYYTDFYFDLGNRHSRILEAWSPNNTNTSIPRLASVDTNNELRPSTYFVEDGSFLRLKNLQIAYTFYFNNTQHKQLRVFIQGSNLFTLTKYQGIDPEVSLASYSSRNRNLDLGVDRGIYPNSRVLSIGANLEF